ncbi:MAG: acetyl-CoA C-acetyltransferase [Bdellovibrionales bacterium]|nr:acetyl-CoA C-acetyltransferase [Bdellovibrionales bacterium]
MGLSALIFDGVRTPRGRGKAGGALSTVRPVELAATTLTQLCQRNRLQGDEIEDVILGCVTAIGDQGANVAKSAAMEAGLPETVAGVTVNRFCGSGLEAVNQAAARVAAGIEPLLIAGGVESMSHVPIGSDGGAWAADPRLAIKTHFVPQGISADLIATLQGFTREQVDQFALTSQQRAVRAQEERRFAKSMVSFRDLNGRILLEHDEHMRGDTTLEGLGQLKPSFAQMGEEGAFDYVALQKYPQLEMIEHVHTAGNSSGIVDGAAALLIGSEEAGKKLGLKPRAVIRACAVTAADPTIMLTGPVPVTRKVLAKAGLKASDIDLFEVNEAFAAVVMNYMRELQVSHDRVNVNGGAIALGHPLGASGAIILMTLLDELERTGKRRGLATLCIGGGMGIATIIERVG